MGKRLTRQEILDAKDLKTVMVPTPEWGEDAEVMVRGFTASECDEYQTSMVSMRTNGRGQDINYRNMRARACVLCVVDDEGKPVFSSEDVQRLGNKSAAPIDRIFDEIQRLSGQRKDALQESLKNSAADQSAVSNSV